jgi:hypothetical protein
VRIPEALETVVIEAIRKVAAVAPDLRDPGVQNLMLSICKESYRAGVIEMQEPIVLEEIGPGPSDWVS